MKFTANTPALVMLLISLMIMPSMAASYLVLPDGSGDYENIQAAVDACVAGDTVLLADGVFTGRFNMDVNYSGKDIVIRSQSGDPYACVIDVAGETNMESERGFIFHNNETSAAVLRDITIINGDADAPCPNCDGGGIVIENASPTIINVVIENSFAASGGAIGVLANSAPTISGCSFKNNDAYSGGALYFLGNTELATVDHCLIYNNSTTGSGGAVYAETDGNFQLINCTLDGNHSPNGGGIRLWDSDAVLQNTIITNSLLGEAVNLYGESTIDITYCDFYGNELGDWVGDISGELGINGNICEDPGYLDEPNGNLHLTGESPCIDAGCPDSPYDPDETIADQGAFFFHQYMGIDDEQFLPAVVTLHPNYPNPFNASTTISFELNEPGLVRLDIFDLLGRHVSNLCNKSLPSGTHHVIFRADKLTSGVYFYRLKADEYSQTKQLVLIK